MEMKYTRTIGERKLLINDIGDETAQLRLLRVFDRQDHGDADELIRHVELVPLVWRDSGGRLWAARSARLIAIVVVVVAVPVVVVVVDGGGGGDVSDQEQRLSVPVC
jgi:hypothetical protein